MGGTELVTRIALVVSAAKTEERGVPDEEGLLREVMEVVVTHFDRAFQICFVEGTTAERRGNQESPVTDL